MRVEVRCRIPPVRSKDVSSASKPSGGIVEAYTDDCFETPTKFYMVSPDHPKLGKWAQPSTLKYKQAVTNRPHASTGCVDGVAHFVSANCWQRSKRDDVNSGHSARVQARSGGTSRSGVAKSSSRVRKRLPESSSNGKRPASAMPVLRPHRQGHRTSTIQGAREAPRISTPVSGRIAPLHQRSLKPSCPPSSIALCGSFDQRQEHPPCHASALTDGMESVDVEGPVQGSIWTAEASTTPFSMKKGNCPYPDDGTHGTEFGARPPPSVEEDVPPEDDPDVQFRVRLDDAALAPRVACDGRQRDGHDGHRAWDSSSRPGHPSQSGEDTMAMQGGGVGTDGTARDAERWIASEVEPFILALRSTLLQEQPADIPSFVSTFANNWRERR